MYNKSIESFINFFKSQLNDLDILLFNLVPIREKLDVINTAIINCRMTKEVGEYFRSLCSKDIRLT